MRAALLGTAAGLVLPVAQCAPATVAGTTDPARAACRILYQSVDGNGDAHMLYGGCMVPRPQVSNDIRRGCLAALNGAWGTSNDHWLACDQPAGS